MKTNMAIVSSVFKTDVLWKFWFEHDWKAYPFLGDISHPPIYFALKFSLSKPSTSWILAKFADEILEVWNIVPPETADGFYASVVTKGFFDEGCFLLTDESEKWGVISYNGDCFIVGGNTKCIENFSLSLGGPDKLKMEFDVEMTKREDWDFGAGAIIPMLPALWKPV